MKMKKIKKMLSGMLALGLIVGTIGGFVYHKTNVKRECEIVWASDEEVIVLHPNGNTYSIVVEEEEIGRFRKGEIIDVVFDEMYDWDTQYVAKDIL